MPPSESAHVRGLAIDVGPVDGAAWLDEHGAALGLCRVRVDGTWHVEPLVEPGSARTCCPTPQPPLRGRRTAAAEPRGAASRAREPDPAADQARGADLLSR